MAVDDRCDEIVRRLRCFVSAEDRTLASVKRIEALLAELEGEDEALFDMETLDDLAIAVALFYPGGGPYLYDEVALASEFRAALRGIGFHEPATAGG